MPGTARFRLKQKDALNVCRCSGPFPNNPVTGTATNPKWPFTVTFPLGAGAVFGDTPEGADDAAQDIADAGAEAALAGLIEDAEDAAGAAPLRCRKKDGSATLCGFEEFDNDDGPSDPPKYYRKLTNSGALTTKLYSGSTDCDPETEVSDVTEDFGGHCDIDKDTCIFSDDGLVNGTCGGTAGGTNLTIVNTKTESTTSGTGCHASVFASQDTSGSWTNTLSEEDTDGDAEDRAVALVGAWTDCSLCADQLCAAYRSDRTGTDDNFFGFRRVETQAFWRAYPQCSYSVVIHFARRAIGSGGPFLDLGQIYEATITAGTEEELAALTPPYIINTEWVEVPNEAGFETIAIACTVTLINFIP